MIDFAYGGIKIIISRILVISYNGISFHNPERESIMSASAIGMYVVSNEKIAASTIGKDERVITIRAAKGSGEKPRYVKVQGHTDNWLSLVSMEVIRELVEKAEDAYLIELVKKHGFLNASLQTREAFEAWFTATQVSSRLSKEAVAAWFQADVFALLVSALEVKGFSNAKAEQVAAEYGKQFEALAGKAPSMDKKLVAQLEKCLALLPEGYESVIGEKVAEKLSGVTEAANILDAL